jgi:5-formyltetrahydrofolate cyclo-ligase
MNAAVEESKTALRRHLRQVLSSLDPTQRDRDSQAIRHRLSSALPSTPIGPILAFLPTPTEPDLLPWLTLLAHRGLTITLPRWHPHSQSYLPAIWNPAQPLVPGPFHILEPHPHQPTLDFDPLDLVLVPGLGFDSVGRRLGRGRGFFDRLLARCPRAQRWGVAFETQILPAIPALPHDVMMHAVATPQRWLPHPPHPRT